MKRKWISLLLCLSLLVGIMPAVYVGAETEKNVLLFEEITSAQDLLVGSRYVLAADTAEGGLAALSGTLTEDGTARKGIAVTAEEQDEKMLLSLPEDAFASEKDPAGILLLRIEGSARQAHLTVDENNELWGFGKASTDPDAEENAALPVDMLSVQDGGWEISFSPASDGFFTDFGYAVKTGGVWLRAFSHGKQTFLQYDGAFFGGSTPASELSPVGNDDKTVFGLSLDSHLHLYRELCSHRDMVTVEEKPVTCLQNGNPAYKKCTNCPYCESLEGQPLTQAETVIRAIGYHVTDATGICENCRQRFAPCEHPRLEQWEQKDAACGQPGNIACWYCPDCEKYFLDEKAEQEINIAETDVILPALEHHFVEGVCEHCGIYQAFYSLIDTADDMYFKTTYVLAAKVEDEVFAADESLQGAVATQVEGGLSVWQEELLQFSARESDGGWIFSCNGKYLTDTGLAEEPVVWQVTFEDGNVLLTLADVEGSYAYADGAFVFGEGDAVQLYYIQPAPCEHDWGEGVETVPATHTEEGLRTYTCALCERVRTESIAKLPEHTFEHYTDNLDGTHTGECVCGEKETVAHVWEMGESIVCTKCGAVHTEHTRGDKTFLDYARHQQVCTACGDAVQEAHNWALTVYDGALYFACSLCGYRMTQPVQVTGLAENHAALNMDSITLSADKRLDISLRPMDEEEISNRISLKDITLFGAYELTVRYGGKSKDIPAAITMVMNLPEAAPTDEAVTLVTVDGQNQMSTKPLKAGAETVALTLTQSCFLYFTQSFEEGFTVLNKLPVITGQPEDAHVHNGEDLFFSVETEGEGLSYQWYVFGNNQPLANSASVIGADSAQLTLKAYANMCKMSGREIYCVVSNENGKVSGDTATLYVSHAVGSGWGYEGDVHWHLCDCGERMEEEFPHTDGDYDGLCDVCGGEVDHIFFSDVSRYDWYFRAVNYVTDEGIFSGYADGTKRFDPAGRIQRQDFALVLARLAKVDLSAYEGQTGGFTDVGARSYYAAAVAWCAENKIITGYTAGSLKGKFGVGDYLTREQLLTMLYRYAAFMGYDTSLPIDALKWSTLYRDYFSVSSFAAEAVCWALEKGVIKGSGNYIMPMDDVVRAEVAQMMVNIYDNHIFEA